MNCTNCDKPLAETFTRIQVMAVIDDDEEEMDHDDVCHRCTVVVDGDTIRQPEKETKMSEPGTGPNWRCVCRTVNNDIRSRCRTCGKTKLEKYGHHPDPLIDAQVEIDRLEGELWNATHGIPVVDGDTTIRQPTYKEALCQPCVEAAGSDYPHPCISATGRTAHLFPGCSCRGNHTGVVNGSPVRDPKDS